MREPQCKNTEQALATLKRFQAELQALQSRYLYTELHGADEDFKTGMLDPLYQVEKASMDLLVKLVDKIEAINHSKPQLG